MSRLPKCLLVSLPSAAQGCFAASTCSGRVAIRIVSATSFPPAPTAPPSPSPSPPPMPSPPAPLAPFRPPRPPRPPPLPFPPRPPAPPPPKPPPTPPPRPPLPPTPPPLTAALSGVALIRLSSTVQQQLLTSADAGAAALPTIVTSPATVAASVTAEASTGQQLLSFNETALFYVPPAGGFFSSPLFTLIVIDASPLGLQGASSTVVSALTAPVSAAFCGAFSQRSPALAFDPPPIFTLC